MRMTYDPEADAVMFRLTVAAVETSEEVAPDVVLDFDALGRVVGIEVLFVSKLPEANPMELAVRVHGGRKPTTEKAA